MQKYIGYLQGALHAFHSGWIIDDYVQEAKKQFQVRHGKIFKHEMVYNILKRLPKFEVVAANIDARVARALNLLDNDIAVNHQQEGAGGGNRNNSNHARQVFASLENNSAADNSDVPDNSLLLTTPRPSTGKKMAKEIAYGARSSRGYNKHQFNTPSSDGETRRKAAELKNLQRSKQTLVLTRIAEVAEAKHRFAQEKLLAQIYLQNPNSARAKAFFARMESRYDSKEQEQDEVVLTEQFEPCAHLGSPLLPNHANKTIPPRIVACSHAGDSEEEEEQGTKETYEAAYARRASLPNHGNKTHAPPRTEPYAHAALLGHPPNVELLYDDDDNDELLDNLPSLPNTQNLMAMVRAMEKRTDPPSTNMADALDSQATTLEQHDDRQYAS